MSASTAPSYPLESWPYPNHPNPFAASAQIAMARRKRHRLLVVLLLAGSLGIALVLTGFAFLAWELAHPPVAPLASNPLQAKDLAYADVAFPSADGRSEVRGWWIPAGNAAVAAADTDAADGEAGPATGALAATVLAGEAGSLGETAAAASRRADSKAERGTDRDAAPPPAVQAAIGGRTVVLSHGYGTNREESWVPMYDIADLAHSLGYNVLMFDYGYANEQHRQPATGGVRESEQLIGALRFARSLGSRETVVWGFSMGAGTALQAALKDGGERLIDGMILDSTFIPDEETIYANMRRYVDLPRNLSIGLVRGFVPMFAGASLAQIPSAEAQSTAFPFPVFVIYGTADDKSPASISANVAAAQTDSRSELWSVPGAIHEMIFRTHQAEYESRAVDFLGAVHEEAVQRAISGTALAAAPAQAAEAATDEATVQPGVIA